MALPSAALAGLETGGLKDVLYTTSQHTEDRY